MLNAAAYMYVCIIGRYSRHSPLHVNRVMRVLRRAYRKVVVDTRRMVWSRVRLAHPSTLSLQCVRVCVHILAAVHARIHMHTELKLIIIVVATGTGAVARRMMKIK